MSVLSLTAIIPTITFAAGKDLNYLIAIVSGYLNKALLLLMGFAVVLFVYYIIQFFMRPSDKRADGAKYLMWSIIGFFVILSFWGIVNLLDKTFNLDKSRPASWSDFFNIFPSNTSSGGSDGNSTQWDNG